MNNPLKLGMITLGCAKNRIDTELFLGLVQKYQIEITNKPKQADILVVNTCGFIESSKKESLDTIFELLDYKKNGTIIIVMGCLVQRYLTTLKDEIPEVDYFIPINDYHQIDQVFKHLTSSSKSYYFDYQNRVLTTYPHTAYLRIGDGCNNNCAYCAIPLIRGSYHSRPHFEILHEAMNLVSRGVKEITIIAQDTCKYGTDLEEHYYLHHLLHDISKIEGIQMVRVLYLYPDEITDELINEIKNNSLIAPYFDIPIQHISDPILQAMNRHGDANLITTVINKIRKQIPKAIIRTTLITGFPGETNEDFTILKDYIQKMQFDRLGVFAFSPEEDTVAYTMDHQVPLKVSKKRREEIFLIQQKISYQLNQKYLGQTTKVVIDYYDNVKNLYVARNYAFAPDDVDGCIYVESTNNLVIGNYYDVEITKVDIYDLYAKTIIS